MADEKQFLWGEANKFGLETAKSLFLMGNASVGVLLVYWAKFNPDDGRYHSPWRCSSSGASAPS